MSNGNTPPTPTRLIRSAVLEEAYAQAKLITEVLSRARALSDILREYQRAQDSAKVQEVAGLIRAALGESTEPDAIRIMDNTLYTAAADLDSDTTEGQAAWNLYLDHFDTRSAQEQFHAHYQALRHLPVE